VLAEGHQLAAAAGQVFEASGVDLLAGQAEPVPRRRRDDRVGTERIRSRMMQP